jgi:hypothetical protein
MTELPWLLLVTVWSKAHKIYGCSLLCLSDETHNGKVTFIYILIHQMYSPLQYFRLHCLEHFDKPLTPKTKKAKYGVFLNPD